MIPPSSLPLSNRDTLEIHNGLEVLSPSICREYIATRPECANHYRNQLSSDISYQQCPFGFTTQRFAFDGQTWFVSGIIAHPRFDTASERALAKKFPQNRVSRASVDAVMRVAAGIESARADAITEGSKVLPQAFHELRKLNGTIMQHSERALMELGDNRNLLSIKGAAELMKNNFDILEALSNIEGMKSIPLDGTVNLFDLSFKMKRVYQERTLIRATPINVQGEKPIIRGSQKSFPLVPAVLLDNAIKYGTSLEAINLHITTNEGRAQLIVENKSKFPIDPLRCFDRGVRCASGIEGGGFGLFLAKEVVSAHNGFIKCETHDGVVRMIVDLPLMHTI
ncbi:hypothetical protein GCM10027276_35960 [Comamonas piscis]